MAKLQKLDKFIIGRGDTTFTASYDDIIDSLGDDLVPEALEYKGSIVVQADEFVDTIPGNTQLWNGQDVQDTGPGNISDGFIATGTPVVGDFYVITYESGVDQEQKAEIEWNEALDPADGPLIEVRPGSMVAFGGTYWNVIGQVATEPVTQDLQSVTEYGNRTNQGLILDKLGEVGIGQGIIVGPVRGLDGAMYVANGGEVVSQEVITQKISFELFEDLPDPNAPPSP